MSNAWVVFDPITLKPTQISWQKPDFNYIEIDKELAKGFMLGTLKLNEYAIFDKDGEKSLEKCTVAFNAYENFWLLKTIDEEQKNFTLIITDNTVEISADWSQVNYILYSSLKDNPSWLINTWMLKDEKIVNGKVTIEVENAKDYSYYLRKIQ